jgi:hypothetical protein
LIASASTSRIEIARGEWNWSTAQGTRSGLLRFPRFLKLADSAEAVHHHVLVDLADRACALTVLIAGAACSSPLAATFCKWPGERRSEESNPGWLESSITSTRQKDCTAYRT